MLVCTRLCVCERVRLPLLLRPALTSEADERSLFASLLRSAAPPISLSATHQQHCAGPRPLSPGVNSTLFSRMSTTHPDVNQPSLRCCWRPLPLRSGRQEPVGDAGELELHHIRELLPEQRLSTRATKGAETDRPTDGDRRRDRVRRRERERERERETEKQQQAKTRLRLWTWSSFLLIVHSVTRLQHHPLSQDPASHCVDNGHPGAR
eukprot:1794467-Rhodomonas_salina.6